MSLLGTKAPPKKNLWKSLMTKPMLITLLMGFSSGMPLLLTLRTLQAWMTDVGVDLKTIGIFALAGIPYSLKFLWSPIFDRYNVIGFGRRRGWLLISQIGLILSIAAMAFIDPKANPWNMALLAFVVSFFSASQDIVVDAYRRETLADEDLGMGSTFYIYGYRIALWVSGALAIGLAAFTSWENVYLVMAAVMLVGVGTTLWSSEPVIESPPPKTLKEAVIDPFREFLTRRGAFYILAFILLYKVGEAMAASMLTPFYFKVGYTKLEVATIAKSFSVFSTLIGSFIGGYYVQKKGIIFSLWTFGIGQSLAVLSIALLTTIPKNLWVLGGIICIEDLTTSMASAAFVAFLASMTNKRYSATQFALLSSLMGIPRVLLSTPTGYIAESLGWTGFFIFCAVITIPGILLIPVMTKLQKA
jgi:MFS transporter, PAT family, beta-lactamase induction signal transducer AmpG